MAQICRTLRAHPGPNRRRVRFPAATPALGGRGLTSAGPRVEARRVAGPGLRTPRGGGQRGLPASVSLTSHSPSAGRGGRGGGRGLNAVRRGAASLRAVRYRVTARAPSVSAGGAPTPRRGTRCPRATSLPQREGGSSPAWSCASARQRRGSATSLGSARKESARPRACGRVSAARSERRTTGESRWAPVARNKAPSGFSREIPPPHDPTALLPSARTALAPGPGRPHRLLSRTAQRCLTDVSVLPGLFYLSYTDDTNGQKPKHFSMEHVLV